MSNESNTYFMLKITFDNVYTVIKNENNFLYISKTKKNIDKKNSCILIIDDSKAISLRLQEFLNNLDYGDVYTCNTGATGISTFTELLQKNMSPIVFLDYHLPDMNAMDVMTKLLDALPITKIILVTATNKSDEGITSLIRNGIDHYIQKPLRFEILKETLEIIESEKQVLCKTVKSAIPEKQTETIDFLLKNVQRISFDFIQQFTHLPSKVISDYLSKLESKGKIQKLAQRKIVICNQCDSTKVLPVYFCPNCSRSHFRCTKLVEHYKCGNIAEYEKYINNECPKCHEKINAVGVDHIVMKNHYICDDCNHNFPDTRPIYYCHECDNKFDIEDARWKYSLDYKILAPALRPIPNSTDRNTISTEKNSKKITDVNWFTM